MTLSWFFLALLVYLSFGVPGLMFVGGLVGLSFFIFRRLGLC